MNGVQGSSKSSEQIVNAMKTRIEKTRRVQRKDIQGLQVRNGTNLYLTACDYLTRLRETSARSHGETKRGDVSVRKLLPVPSFCQGNSMCTVRTLLLSKFRKVQFLIDAYFGGLGNLTITATAALQAPRPLARNF